MIDPLHLVLVDDQAMVRAGFRMVLDAQPDMVVTAEFGDGAEVVDALTGPTPPACEVVIMDIRMPRLDGVEATRRLVEAGCPARTLVLTTFDLDEYAYAALQAGAAGFLLKDAGPADLLAAIHAVAAGDAVVAPSTTKRLLERFLPTLPESGAGRTAAARLDVLTDREREVLTAVGQGLSNTEIAARLFLAEPTVKTHIGRILTKLDLRDRVQMVVLAYDAGLVRPQP